MIEIFTHGMKELVPSTRQTDSQRICHHHGFIIFIGGSYPYRCNKCWKPLTDVDIA